VNRNTIVAVALCVLVLIGYPYLLKLFGLDHYLKPVRPPQVATGDSLRAADTSGRATGALGAAGAARPAPAGGTPSATPAAHTVLAALPPGLAKALIGKWLTLETLRDVRELRPVLQRS